MNLQHMHLDPACSILTNLMKKHYPFNLTSVTTSGAQTNPEEIGYSIEQKLMLIDQQYRHAIGKETTADEQAWKDRADKIKEIEAHFQKQYSKDVERFKQFEVHRIQVQVGEKWRKKYQELARALEQDYKQKIDGVRKKDKLLTEDLVQQRKMVDQKSLTLESNFKSKINMLDMKSMTVQKQMENLSAESKNKNAEVKIKEQELKEKIN